jgi:hypothetical protein
MSMVAQEKAPCSYVSEINDQTIGNYALSDFFYDQSSKMYYKAVNDNKNFAVLIKMDSNVSHGLFMRGLEIWVNNGNKKKKSDGIKYPIPQTPDFGPNELIEPKEGAEFEIQSSEIGVVGFGYQEEQIFPSNKSNEIHGSIKLESDDMVLYQVLIPIEKLKSAIEISKPFGLLINSGEMKRPQNDRPMGEGPPMSEMDNEHMPPQGGRPGRPGPGGQPLNGNFHQNIEIMIRNILIQTK